MSAMLPLLAKLCSCGEYGMARSSEEEEMQAPGLVTVLQRNGTVLEYPHKLRCSELLAAHPSTRVFPAAVLVGQPGSMVPEDATLECGQIYALLPTGTRMRMPFTVPKEYSMLLGGREPHQEATPPQRSGSSRENRAHQGGEDDALLNLSMKGIPGSRVHNCSGPLSGLLSEPLGSIRE